MNQAIPGSDRAQSLYKGMQILQCFGSGNPTMTLTEVSEKLAMNKATSRRFLLTLVDMGYLLKTGRLFSLTPKVMSLGYNYLSALPWWEMAQPIASEITRTLKESCSISMLSNHHLVFVAREQGPRALTLNMTPSRVVPTWCTSVGRVLLAELTPDELVSFYQLHKPVRMTPHTLVGLNELKAELKRIKVEGRAIVNQELEIGLIGFAVPVKDRQGRTFAAIGVSAHAQRYDTKKFEQEILPTLRDAAERLGNFA